MYRKISPITDNEFFIKEYTNIYMRKYIFLAIGMVAAMLNTSCKQDEFTGSVKSKCIIASMLPAEGARTAVGNAVDGTNAVGIMWSDGDQIGVFDSENGTQKCYAKVGAGEAPTASFAASGTAAFDEPLFAYYPYSSDNDGVEITALNGELPATQSMADRALQGDYKYGRVKEATTEGYEFVFAHMFSLARVVVDAANTPMAGDELKSVKVSVLRDGTPIAVAGKFQFNARTGTWAMTGEGATSITLACNETTVLGEAVESYMSIFPNVKKDDVFSFEVTSKNYTATFTAASLVNFSREQIYNFPVALNNFKSIKIYDSEGVLVQDGPNNGGGGDTPDPTPDPNPVPEPIIGAFTCAALNVDGLPDISYVVGSVNPDGPGASGTTKIGQMVNSLGWDFLAVSEDFEYHNQLVAAMTNYSCGKYRGTVTSSASLKTADTDGLGFFWKNTVSAANETIVEFNDAEGDLISGANTCIKKGFRHYEITVAEGVVVDVYITHMNTYSGSGNTESNGHWAAQMSQLKQMRDYVLNKAKANSRPAIIIGDTNCRYTRHKLGEYLIDYINNNSGDYAGYTISDPWVEFHRGGVYPSWNTKSLMTRAAFAGDKDNDICCSDDQRGEVVDKCWYINVPGAAVQLKATSCKNDVDNFIKSTESVSYSGVSVEDANGNVTTGQTVSYTKNKGLADHFPVVVEFEYTYTPQQ